MRSIEEIILEKNYNELSIEEQNLVSELADNEEEFNEMKQLFANMSVEFDSAEVFVAPSETKASLDQIFSAKHPVIANDWKKEEVVAEVEEVKIVAFYNKTWVRVAALLILFFGISVLYIQNSNDLLKQNEIQQANNAGFNKESKSSVQLAKSDSSQKSKVDINSELNSEATTKKEEVPQLAFAEDNYELRESNDETTFGSGISDGIVASKFSNGIGNSRYNANSDLKDQLSLAPATSSAFSSNIANGTTTYSFTTSDSEKANNWGRLADLDPSLNMSKPTSSESSASGISVSKEGLAAEMLDWIQAAY